MQYIPHNYQAYCIQLVTELPAVGLFLRPGLGKTSITLSAVNILKYFRWQVSKVLVVAPKKVAEATWQKEAARWDHTQHLRISTVLGSASKRIKALSTPADIYVINRENVEWLVDYYKQAWPFDMVVLDESTSFKNSQSKRFKAMRRVRRFIKRMVLLTGTPSSKGLIDLWAQVYLLDGGERLGPSLSAYRERYFDPDQRSRTQIFSYKAKDGAESAVLAAISDICISMKAEDYLQLPDFIQHEIPVMLDAKAKRDYDQFERDLLLEVDEDIITAGTAGVLVICDGSIRSGKTVAMTVGFVMWAMARFNDQNFAICGKTIESLRRNVTSNLPKWLVGVFSFKEHRTENKIVVSAAGRSNSFYLFGGKDESSASLIQGITLAGILLDEVALMPESFVNQATGRCSVAGSKLWFNCNPEGPSHWFYKKWLEGDQPKKHNVLHLHFTMEDNYSLTQEIKDRYTMSGVTPWINWKTDSTCEGYALMLQQLLAISDILVIYVSGAARDGCGHAWLIVYLREINWRIIDVTITDTGFGEVFTYEKHEPIFSYSHGVNNHDIY